jgi:integrase
MIPESVLGALKCVSGLRYGKTAARESEPVKPVPDALVDAILPYVAPPLRAMIELQRVTGMRSGKVCQMRTCDINVHGAVWTYTPARHKTQFRGHTRTVFLGPRSQEILKPWLRIDVRAFLFSPAEAEEWRRNQRHSKRKTPLLCGNRPGTNRVRKPRRPPGDRYTAGSYGRAIQYGCELAFGMPSELRRAPANETQVQRGERNKLAAEWRKANCWYPYSYVTTLLRTFVGNMA